MIQYQLLFSRWGLACLSLVLTVAYAQPATPLPGRIAFVSSSGRLATVAPDGSDMRLLSAIGEVFQFPAWSPVAPQIAAIGSGSQGSRLAVFADDQGVDIAEREQGRDLQTLYRSQAQAPFYLYWSPDGQRVGFLANHPQEGIGLHMAELADSSSSLLRTGSPLYWQWMDAAQLLIHRNGLGDAAQLTLLELNYTADHTANHTERSLDAPGLFQVPGVASSGDFIAFGGRDALGNGRLVLRDAPTAALTDEAAGEAASPEDSPQVLRQFPHQGLLALSWSPRDDKLAFISPPSAAPHSFGFLRLLEAHSGELEVLVEELVLAFFWSPDGRYIAYLTPMLPRPPQEFADAGAYAASSLAQDMLAQNTAQQAPMPLHLQLSVLELDSRQSRHLSTFVPSDAFLQQFLPFFDQYALSHRLWSPDSRALVLPMRTAQGSEAVTVVPIDGSEVQRIAQGHSAFWSWQ